MKTVRAQHLLGGDSVHFLWALPEPLPEEVPGACIRPRAIAHDVVAFGWRWMVSLANGAILTQDAADALPGERWLQLSGQWTGLRLPISGTLDALIRRHLKSLGRLTDGRLTRLSGFPRSPRARTARARTACPHCCGALKSSARRIQLPPVRCRSPEALPSPQWFGTPLRRRPRAQAAG